MQRAATAFRSSTRSATSASPEAATSARARSTGDVVAFLNPDTVVSTGLPAALEEPLRTGRGNRHRSTPSARRAGASPRLGHVIHVSGIGWSGGYGEPADGRLEPPDVSAPSGAAMAIRSETFHEFGGFADEFFMYRGGRSARVAGVHRGHSCRRAPRRRRASRVRVRPQLGRTYFLERNRLVFVGSCFSPRSLVVLAPLLVATELAMVAFASEGGLVPRQARRLGMARPKCGARRLQAPVDAGPAQGTGPRPGGLADTSVRAEDDSGARPPSGSEPARRALLGARQARALTTSSVVSSPGTDGRRARRNVVGSLTP